VATPLQKISDPRISSSGVNLYVLRLDMNHPHISGNKFYKLKYNLEEAKKQGKDTLLTFGGAYSNHIAATAAAGKEFDLNTIGIIRGDEVREPSHTLKFAKSYGMKLHFISREKYRRITASKIVPENILSEFRTPDSQLYILPEGGTNDLAIKGCAEILSLIDIPFDYVCCPVGTAGTIVGIISSLKESQKAIGFSVLKAPEHHEAEIKKRLSHFQINSFSNFQISDGYHFGGYAKYSPELLNFIADFEKINCIQLDHVYTGKMMFGIYDLIRRGNFKQNQTIIAIHTGGIQGRLVKSSA
jgi:1-aminocyclopropane-1-carboxylate deaminase